MAGAADALGRPKAAAARMVAAAAMLVRADMVPLLAVRSVLTPYTYEDPDRFSCSGMWMRIASRLGSGFSPRVTTCRISCLMWWSST
jgi:hypothetical protein